MKEKRITKRHVGHQIKKLNRVKNAGDALKILDDLKKEPELYWAVKKNW